MNQLIGLRLFEVPRIIEGELLISNLFEGFFFRSTSTGYLSIIWLLLGTLSSTATFRFSSLLSFDFFDTQ